MVDFSEAGGWCGADLLRGAVGAYEMRKGGFDRLVAPAQGVIFGVRHGRRVEHVVGAVVAGDFGGQFGQFDGGLEIGQAVDGKRFGFHDSAGAFKVWLRP